VRLTALEEVVVIGHPQWTHLDERFAPKGANAYIIECPTCGYEPDEQVVMRPVRCPKCHSFTWHRVPRPGMLADILVGEPTFDRQEYHHGATV
jgi:hypothetical protein